MADFTASANAVEDCHYTLAVTIPAETVDAAFKKVRRQIKKQARIPGFRPGKAPDNLINRRFGDKMVDEVKQELLRENLQGALKQEDLQPVTYPMMVPDHEGTVAEGQEFAFTVEFDVQPKVDVPEYKGLELTQYKVGVDDEKIDKAIDDLREQRSAYEVVERVAESGDMLKVSYSSKLDTEDEVPESTKRMLEVEETWLLLREPEMFPGITEGLAGISADEEKTLEIEFGDDYYEPFLTGKKVEYTFKVLEVHGRALPELTDEFAKQIGAEGVDDLKAKVRERMEGQLKNAQSEHLRSQVAEKLLDGCDIALPPKVLEQETDMAFREMERQAAQQHQHTEECDHDEEKEKEERQEQAAIRAAERLRLRYLIEAISEKEEIKVDHEEIRAQMAALRQHQGLTEKQFSEQYNEMAVVESMYMNSLRERVLDKLIEEAEITETEPPEADEEEADK